jgi:alkylation response protein AidB-like acyl-CoA dehydrogenase
VTSLDYYAIEELLTDDERAARDRARRFVEEEVRAEIVSCHRAAKFPEHLRPRMGALRFFAPHLKEHGCAGLSYTPFADQNLEKLRIDRRSKMEWPEFVNVVCQTEQN